jgi:hypothetical protein
MDVEGGGYGLPDCRLTVQSPAWRVWGQPTQWFPRSKGYGAESFDTGIGRFLSWMNQVFKSHRWCWIYDTETIAELGEITEINIQWYTVYYNSIKHRVNNVMGCAIFSELECMACYGIKYLAASYSNSCLPRRGKPPFMCPPRSRRKNVNAY